MTPDPRTRARLLKTAEELFGERGFKKVTVREICRAARANVAAVNYHFGDKEGLYREVLQSAIDRMRATSDAAREEGRGRPPEEQLRRYLRIFLARVLSPESVGVHRLITREVNDPTPAFDALVEQGLRPRIEYLSGLVAAIMKCDRKDPRVLRCVGSIQSQAFTYLKNPIATRLGFIFKPTPEFVEQAADHIATFSIAGIRAIART
ncbi:MAG: CerR family C-terminal domain-containing protein [Vicinamibacteria bacterium]|nr:CerR family C-terminal domain-containing protein [Vicinamibacteria bacterium]